MFVCGCHFSHVHVCVELMYLHRCQNATHREYLFDDLDTKWCHGHSLTPYHGEMLRYSNTGVMLLKPSEKTFDALLDLLAVEPTYNDTCIGLGMWLLFLSPVSFSKPSPSQVDFVKISVS